MSWEERWKDGDTPWDKGAPAPPLVDLLAEKPEYFKGEVIVPGCGRGHDALAIARAGFPAIGLDISSTALKCARELDEKKRVKYLVANFLTAMREDYPKVRTIFEHTCFCAIQPSDRESYRNACMRLLPAGGLWVAIIFLTPREEDDPTIGPPFQSKVEEIEELFSAHFTLVEQYIPENTFTARKGKELVMVWRKI